MPIKKAILGLTVAIVLLALVEFACRLLEHQLISQDNPPPGWQTEFFADIMDWQERDLDLLWRFKANLNLPFIQTGQDHLLTSPAPPAAERKVRLMILGDSSPVGMGLADRRQAFGDQLVRMLNAGSSDFAYELINAAVPGYSSEQIRRWFELEGMTYKPDLVILYAGNNDASISGRYTDRQLFESQPMGTIRRALYHLALYRILCYVLHERSDESGGLDDRAVVRVSPEEYAENIAAIAKLCRRNGIGLVIVKPPVPLDWPAGLQFKPFNNLKSENGRPIMPEPIREVFDQPFKYCLSHRLKSNDGFVQQVYGAAFDDSLSPLQSIEAYQSALDTSRSNPVLWNDLAVAMWELDIYSSAAIAIDSARTRLVTNASPLSRSIEAMYLYNHGIISRSLRDTLLAQMQLDSALQQDYLSLRVKRTYLSEIDSIATADYIHTLDLPSIFDTCGGDTLFVDHCHPTAVGHTLIAKSLIELLWEEKLIDR